VSGGTNSSGFWLAGRGRILGPNYGVGYFGGLTLNADGIPGKVRPWINNGSTVTRGSTFNIQQIPLPYRFQSSGVGTNLSLRVLNLTTGQLIREVPTVHHSTFTNGFVGLVFNGETETRDSYTNTVDNFLLSGTKQ
jgi:hypothetical protein